MANGTSMTTRATDMLSREEIRRLTRRSDLRGVWAIFSTWAVIGGCFAALALWPHPAVFISAVVILGGRQLALAILMHEAAHRTLFRTHWFNDVVTDWLCARPILNDVARYRKHHLRHHQYAGTEADPDLSLIEPFPTTRRSLIRKFTRDLLGLTGLKRLVGLLLMNFELLEYSVAGDAKRRPRNERSRRDLLSAGMRNTFGFVVTNLVLAGILGLSGQLWVYWAWVVANMTTFSLFVRIRSLAEHACTEMTTDVFRNTRTTKAGLLARATVAPIRVNFHLEHHLLVGVPYFMLPRMHELLRERGAPAAAPGYRWILDRVTRDQSA